MWSGAQAARYALKADTFANPLDLEFGSEADSPQRETVSEAAVGGSGALNPAETSPVFSFIPTSRHNQPLPPPFCVWHVCENVHVFWEEPVKMMCTINVTVAQLHY